MLSHPIALALALFSFLLLGLVLSNLATCTWFLLAVAVCALPGWFACKLLYGYEYAKRLDSLGHTLFLGFLLTTFLSVVIASLGPGLTIPTMLIGALGGALALFLVGRWITDPLSAFQDDDLTVTRLAITTGLILVLVIVAGPFLNVGRRVRDSYAYAPYFNRDFLRNLAFGATLSKGAIPPANPYFDGETLHYYWFQAVIPALVYQLTGRSAALEDILLLSSLLINISFVFVFVHLMRRFVKTIPALIIIIGLAFAAESYQAPFKAVLSLQPTHWVLEGTWLGAIALPPVGYFLQHLLYLPHHLAALVALLIVVSLVVERSLQGRVARALSAVAILVLASGFSFFIVAFGFLWIGSHFALQAVMDVYAFAKNRESAQCWSSFVVTTLSGITVGIAGLATYVILSGLQMLLGDVQAWRIHVSKLQLAAPLHFFVMLGPMSVLGIGGFTISVRDKTMRSRYSGLLWLLLSALSVVMFLLPPSHMGLWEVSQKLGVVLRIPVLVLSGIFLDQLVNRGIRQRRIAWAVLILFCASALPNLLAYEYVHFNVGKSNLLTYVGASEKRAAEWIRTQTPLNAVVQAWPGGQTSVESYYRPESNNISLVPVFGERQTAIGDPQFAHYFIAHSNHEDVDARAIEISRIYEEPGRSDVVGILEKYSIDYVYWGISERQCCLENLVWYEESVLFEKVYDRDGVSIFRSRRG
jgi:hypothetical protein